MWNCFSMCSISPFPAPCDGGKIYSPTGGNNCQCSTVGSMICIISESAGCYCPSDSYINDQGVCTLKTECRGKCMNERTFTPVVLSWLDFFRLYLQRHARMAWNSSNRTAFALPLERCIAMSSVHLLVLAQRVLIKIMMECVPQNLSAIVSNLNAIFANTFTVYQW